ncbi:microfibril-associated glycoprotein 4-like isoform X5 [Zophobas morio]|uniref:microfibril-associated glycoprotein 4-like isoform X5 n=1 Tax=Zophobas morio TaxID=2755281 RepID=UPI003082F862
MQKMVSKIVLLLMLLFKNVFLNPSDTDDFSVVSTSKSQRKLQLNGNDPSFVRAELLSEIHTTLDALKESVNNLQNIKREIIEEVENVVEEKINIYDAGLKLQLSQTKTEIVSETKENVIQQLTQVKNEMTRQMNALRESTESVLSQNEKQLGGIQSNLQLHFEKMKYESSAILNFNEIKSQLKNTREEILSEVRQCERVPSDCREIQKQGFSISGVYRIQPKSSLESFLVWCDMSTRGGGWTYVLNRFDGSQNFNLKWTDYKQGFGSLSGEHWLGLDHLYEFTNSKPTELLFQLMDRDSKTVYALYNRFQIGTEAEHYQIKTLGSYNGNAGDSFQWHDGATFSTADNDHSSCASGFEGGWWFTDCYQVLLTGKYIKNPTLGTDYYSAITWYHFHGFNYSLKEARMMIRMI